MSQSITVKIPVGVARFLYSALEYFITGDTRPFKPKLTASQRRELVELTDELAYQISMEGVR